MQQLKNPVGIWLDYREAYIVYVNGSSEVAVNLASNIDESHPVGGSGSSTPYGSQEAISETRHLRRRKRQEKQYFQSIIEKIRHRDGIYILGPAQAKLGLEHELKKDPNLLDKILTLDTCDRITNNQIRAKIRDFFLSLHQNE